MLFRSVSQSRYLFWMVLLLLVMLVRLLVFISVRWLKDSLLLMIVMCLFRGIYRCDRFWMVLLLLVMLVRLLVFISVRWLKDSLCLVIFLVWLLVIRWCSLLLDYMWFCFVLGMVGVLCSVLVVMIIVLVLSLWSRVGVVVVFSISWIGSFFI